MKIVAAYTAVLEDGTELVPGTTYDVSNAEGHALIYRGHAATAQETPVADLPAEEDPIKEQEDAPTTRKRVK